MCSDPIARERRKGMYKTAPYDPRFPNTNQTKRCWLNYVDYWKCAKLKGEDNPVCGDFLYAYKQKCPQVWVSIIHSLTSFSCTACLLRRSVAIK